MKLTLSIRVSTENNAYLESNPAAVTCRDFNFENRSKPAPEAAPGERAQVGQRPSRQQIENVQTPKFSRSITSAVLARLVHNANVAIGVESEDDLINRDWSHLFLAVG